MPIPGAERVTLDLSRRAAERRAAERRQRAEVERRIALELQRQAAAGGRSTGGRFGRFEYVQPKPFDASTQRIARAMAERAKLAYIERYRHALPGFDVTKSRAANIAATATAQQREISAIMRREGVSAPVAAARLRRSNIYTSQLKDTYRKRGLYFGNSDGSYDPILQRAADIRFAGTPEEQNAAIDAYTGAYNFQQGARLGQRQQIARRVQQQLPVRDIDALLAAIKVGGQEDPATTEFLTALRGLIADPSAALKNPEGLIQGYAAYKQMVEGAQQSSPGGFAGFVQNVMDAPILGHGLRALGVPIEEVAMQPYYASSYARDQGGGLGRQIASGLSAFPGLGFLAGGASARDRRATDSHEERAALGLKSFGQNVTGRDEWYTSGLVDAGLQIFGDPLNAVTLGTGKLARVGSLADDAALSGLARESGIGILRTNLSSPARLRRVMEDAAAKGLSGPAANAARAAARDAANQATAAARASFIEGTRRGRNLTRAAEDAIREGFDSRSIQRAIPGLDQRAAQRIAEATTHEEAVTLFKQAFVSGEYNPSIVLRRQLLGGAGEGKVGKAVMTLPGGIGFGPRLARSQDGLFNVVGRVRRAARPTEIRAVSRQSAGQVHAATYNVVRAGLARAGKRLNDVYDDVAQRVFGLAPEERLGQVYEALEGTASLEDLFERSFKKTQQTVHKTLGLQAPGKKGSTLSDWSTLVNSSEFEAWLKQMEVVAELATGKYGKEAAQQVAVEAKFGLARKEASASKLTDSALKNLGVKLPDRPVAAGDAGTVSHRLVDDLDSPLDYGGVAAKRIAIYEDGAGVTSQQYFKDEADLVGFVDYTPGLRSPDEAYIHYVAVRSDFRQRGLSDELVRRLYSTTDLDVDWGEIHSNAAGRLWTRFKGEFPDRGNYAKVRFDQDAARAFVPARAVVSPAPSTGKIGLGQMKPDDAATYLDARIRAYISDPDAQEVLAGEAQRVLGLKKPGAALTKLERRVEAFIASDGGEELGRLVRNQNELVGAAEGALTPVGGLRRLINPPLRLVDAMLEPISPSKVAFLGFENDALAVAKRVESFDRYFSALGLDDFTRTTLRQSAERITNEAQMYNLVSDALRLKASREGLPEGLLLGILKERQTALKNKQATLVAQVEDGTFEVTDEVYTLAQKGEIVYLPDPDDVLRTIREAKANLGDIPARLRRGIAKPLDLSLFGLKGIITGDDLTVRNLIHKVHRSWKYKTVVPGLELAALGATVGYAATDGSVSDRLKGAGAGASIGLLTPLRYVMRVAGIEEGMRKYLAEGYNPEVWVPHIGRFRTQFGLDLPFRPINAVKAGDPVATDAQRLLSVAHDGWSALAPTRNPVRKLFRRDTRFLDSYGRIINYQAHPESDFVSDMFLRWRAGEQTLSETLAEFGHYMKSDSGKAWMKRHKTAHGGATTPEEAFARHEKWFTQYFPDQQVAAARLDAARSWAVDGVKRDVDVGVLKAAQRRNSLPDFIHAENRFRVPKNFREVALLRDRLTSKFAFEGPTTMLNRAPMAKAIYREEYRDLIAAGVAPKRAQEIAEQTAVETTNRIMFRIDDESRFAAKVDIVFPFQQPREELLRVWAPLITRNPARAMHMGRLAALAFNNGKENGMFQQDQYGNWRMVVPGSGYLSKTLFNASAAFDFDIQNLVFFGQGAYNINVIPSPGGPFFGTLTRWAINRNPEWYENLPDWQREWLTPYGANGRLFRPEVSRMWQAWLGEPAPFEFASRVEQEDALEKHRRFVFLQLIWQHGKRTGNYNWRPSDEELDQAVSGSLKAWAFIGAVTPATPGYLRPDAKALAAVQGQFVAANGEWDYYKFIEQYPMWEPWLISGTKTVDDSFEEWVKTSNAEGLYDAEQAAMDTTTHRRRQMKFSEWRKELDERQRESAAYRERSDIFWAPAHLQQDLYSAWDVKYPDLAMRSHDNYERDIELMHIEGSLIGESKDRALDAWRKRYDVSPGLYRSLRTKIEHNTLRSQFDPWDGARPAEAVFDDVQAQLRRMNYKRGWQGEYEAELRLTRDLPVAEQVKYWQWRMNHMTYDGTPEEVLDHYKVLKGHVSGLWKTPPMRLSFRLGNSKPRPNYNVEGEARAERYREQISEAYAQAYELDAQVKALEARGVTYGSTISALRKRRRAFFDMAFDLKNEWYKSIPDSEGLIADIKAVAIFTARGRTDLVNEIRKYREEYGFFLPSGEQDQYLDMNSEVRQAYVDDLVERLSVAPNDSGYKEGGLFWEWLTDFQQELLTANLPREQVEQWKRQKPSTGGGSGKGFGRSSGNAELDYAYAMFRKYNQRGNLKPPAAYQEYLDLPNDAVLRTAFLRQHPEVADYIAKGPMANMPPSIAMQVADIMIRYGKWDGESRSAVEISEIGFAKEMMLRWNRRGNRTAPASLQLWIDMPTGARKAEYLRQHPEIGEWLQLGPMANMPEAYREVVRDIMFRYGLWTDSQDPLGKTIAGYYSTPRYLKDKYLEEHPELVEYWKATRSPEEQRYYELADTYYGLVDHNARRNFLSMHPELQQWFLDQRQRRYENFLNQVAVYMGSNPELFTKYLERQEDILTELLHKFSEIPLMRERYIMRDVAETDRRAAA